MNRILRLYISKRSPSEDLKVLVYYIIAFYIPGWFYIKQHSICTQGVKNFFKLISLARNLSPECRNIVYSVLQNNGYWAHVENILLAALFDEDLKNRGIAPSLGVLVMHYTLNMDNIGCPISTEHENSGRIYSKSGHGKFGHYSTLLPA